jgi:anaerobic sulfite reductase subunit B
VILLELVATGPIGTCFPMDELRERPLLLIGGGSGITALRSVMHSLPENAPVKLIYSAKSVEDLIYRDEVDAWRKNEMHYVTLTQTECEGYHHGRFTQYIADLELPDNLLVFICGPAELVKNVAQQLHDKGVQLDAIFGSLPTTALKGGPVYRADHPNLLNEKVVPRII